MTGLCSIMSGFPLEEWKTGGDFIFMAGSELEVSSLTADCSCRLWQGPQLSVGGNTYMWLFHRLLELPLSMAASGYLVFLHSVSEL